MTTYNDTLSRFITELFASHDPALQRAWEGTTQKRLPAISVRPEEGRFLQFLVRACGARKAVEIGTLGGYSGIWIARGLSPGGRLFTIERESRHAEVARRHFSAAGLEDRIEIRVGDAHGILKELSLEGPFDFIFIDAEKSGYQNYFDWAFDNTRPGGVIAAHNAFRGGRVVDNHQGDEDTRAIANLLKQVAANPHLISTIFPAGDGTLIAVMVE